MGINYLETQLTLDFAGVQADMDLGRMPLTTLFMNLKGTQATLNFSEPALFTLRKCGISCEGTFLTVTGIGNTGFETFQLKAKGSGLGLDFNGVYTAGDYNADFDLSGSSARINLPATAGASVVPRPSNPPVALTGSGWPQEPASPPETYVTDDYEDRESRINLSVASKAATVHIKREGTNLQYQLSY